MCVCVRERERERERERDDDDDDDLGLLRLTPRGHSEPYFFFGGRFHTEPFLKLDHRPPPTTWTSIRLTASFLMIESLSASDTESLIII